MHNFTIRTYGAPEQAHLKINRTRSLGSSDRTSQLGSLTQRAVQTCLRSPILSQSECPFRRSEGTSRFVKRAITARLAILFRGLSYSFTICIIPDKYGISCSMRDYGRCIKRPARLKSPCPLRLSASLPTLKRSMKFLLSDVTSSCFATAGDH